MKPHNFNTGRSHWPLWVLMGAAMLMLSSLSIARYLGYNAGMLDLGNMAQAIWSATQGQPLVFTQPFGAYSRLSGHAEIIYFLFAPAYALWPDPRVLLIGQALLYALGALPVYAMALRRTASVFAARCLALIYLCYPVAQTAVLFDFHGDTLAMPLLLFALDALDRRAWRSYALFIALALTCKVYIAAPVAGIGAYLLLWGGQRRAGLLTIGAATLYGVAIFFGMRPLFASHVSGVAATSRSYLDYYFGAFDLVWATLDKRVLNALIVFGPALLTAWRGWRWLLVSLPVTAAVLLTSGPGGASDYRYHHYATVVPFVVMAAIDGAGRMQAAAEQRAVQGRRRGRSWRGDLGLTAAIVILCNAVLVDTPLNPLFWLAPPGQGLDSSGYGITARDHVKDRFLAEQVPPDAPLAASNFLAPRLTNRETLFLVRYPDEPDAERLPRNLPQIDYALADALFDYYIPLDAGYAGGLDYDRGAIALLLRDPAFALVAARDGLLLFARDAAPEQVLPQIVETLPAAPVAASRLVFGDAIELVDYAITPLAGRRVQASFTWRAVRPLTRPLVAVSALAGVEGARMVHLPTYALLPPVEWAPGALIRETFTVELPPELPAGTYTWQVGWYDVWSPVAAATDTRSLLPGSRVEALTTVIVP